MTVNQKLAIVNAIIAANAALIGEQPAIRATMLGRKVRVGNSEPNTAIMYPNIDFAVAGAIKAFGRAADRYVVDREQER